MSLPKILEDVASHVAATSVHGSSAAPASDTIVQSGPDGKIAAGWLGGASGSSGYELCEFYFFRHPVLRPGFQPAQGGLLQNAAALYPEAWAYLQTEAGLMLCKTEEEWRAMTTATWATLANGATVGWNGIGGAPFYAPNWTTGALRLPDLRGMYAEAAGFDSLGVGGVHGDAVRNITGRFWGNGISNSGNGSDGAFYTWYYGGWAHYANSGGPALGIDVSRVIPTANKNQPRAFGVLPCVYLGAPN